MRDRANQRDRRDALRRRPAGAGREQKGPNRIANVGDELSVSNVRRQQRGIVEIKNIGDRDIRMRSQITDNCS
jgi:hypothetical protein